MYSHEMFNEVLAAWSTVAAVVVALFIPVVRPVWAWIRRPKLEITVGGTEPHCVLPWDSENRFSFEEILIRIRVHNKGHDEAKNTWMRIERFFSFDAKTPGIASLNAMSQDPGWCLLFEEPANLRWPGVGAMKQVVIPAGSVLFAELADYLRGPKDFTFRTTEQIIGNPGPHGSQGCHIVEVTLGAEDIKPITKFIQVTITIENGIECIKLRKAPTKHSNGRLLAAIEEVAGKSFAQPCD